LLYSLNEMLLHIQKSIQGSKNELKSGFNLKAVAQTVWHYCNTTTSMAFTIMFKRLGSRNWHHYSARID